MENLLKNMVLHWTGNLKGFDARKEEYEIPKSVWEQISVVTLNSNVTMS
jgi:hypothetical protein